MDIFSIFTLLGGLAFFLFGMSTMSQSLEKMAGSKLEIILRRMTSNRFKALFLGMGITVAIQSSSAVTVMLVGLVNSNVMTLGQSIGVIMGTNIGTTVTAWILSLTSIQSDNIVMQLCKPKNFSPLLAFIGIIMIMTSKKQRNRDIGRTLIGFTILMYGMQLMESALKPLSESAEFAQVLLMFSNPLLGVIIGAGFTALIQSSSASVGILQALASTGVVTGGVAIPIILGQNIGTCITALLSSIGVNSNARRVAVVHISFNLIGTSIFMIMFYTFHALFPLEMMTENIDAWSIAKYHTLFNLFTTALLLPFTAQLEKLANKVISTKEEAAKEIGFLDKRLIATPGVAVTECVNLGDEMAIVAQKSVLQALSLIWKYDAKVAEKIERKEDMLDTYEARLSSYLVEISRHNISPKDSYTVARLLHSVGDFERLGDHAMNVLQTSQELQEKKLSFSAVAEADLRVLFAALEEILTLTFAGYAELSVEKCRQVEPLEETIDNLIAEIRLYHIQRLQDGACTIQLGLVLSDLLTDCERISDHCSNIALRVLESVSVEMDHHAYKQGMHKGSDFISAYQANMEKYALPKR